MNSKKQLFLILAVCCSAIFFYSSFRMFFRDDKTLIYKVIYGAAAAVESGDTGRCRAFLSDSYNDSQNGSKEELLKRLAGIFEDYPVIKVKIRGFAVTTEPSAVADVSYIAYLTKKSNHKEYYDSAKLKIYFKKENKSWKISGLEYLNTRDMLFLQEVA